MDLLPVDPSTALLASAGSVALLMLGLVCVRIAREVLRALEHRWHPGLFAALLAICDGRDVPAPRNPLRAERLTRMATEMTGRVRGTDRNLLGAWLAAHGQRSRALECLGSPSAARRAHGIHLYLACTTYGSLLPVADTLRDPDARVRLTAVQALGATGREDAVTALVLALEEGHELDHAAVVRAGVRVAPSTCSSLRGAYRSTSTPAIAAAVEITAQLRLVDARADLERLATSPAPEVRARVEEALGRIGRAG